MAMSAGSFVCLYALYLRCMQSVSVLMEGVPEGIDPDQMLEDLYAIPGVKEVHDLHIWSLSVG